MAITLGKVGKATANDTNTITATWTGGGSSVSGSTLLALLSTPQLSTLTPTTPAGWTLRISSISGSLGSFWVYEIINASAISGLTINYSTGNSVPVALDIVEFQGAGSLDSSTSVNSASSGTTETTNGITTGASNTVMVAFFTARGGATPRTLSTPGAGFTQCQSSNGATGDTICTANYTTYQVVSAAQSNVSTTCAISVTSNWQCVLLAYAQAVPAFVPSPRRRKRLFKRLVRRAGKRRFGFALATLVSLFPFLRRRRRLRVLRALRRRRGFYGDLTPIAPVGQCFTITVSEELGATMAVSEELAAGAIEVERLSALGTAFERLSATGLVQANLGCTVTIVCCR